MKVLFDQGTPVPLRRQLAGHTIDTVYEQGWSTLTNGRLLATAEQAGYREGRAMVRLENFFIGMVWI